MSHPQITSPRHTTLLESPPGERRWGFYQFPDMVRAPGGEIYVAVNVGHDAIIGDHETGRFFVSRNEGATWSATTYDAMDLSPYVVTFSDGSQVSFGNTRMVYHVHSYGPHVRPKDHFWHFAELGVAPASGPMRDAYDNHDWMLYRIAD